MKILRCKKCGELIPNNEGKCPFCGFDNISKTQGYNSYGFADEDKGSLAKNNSYKERFGGISAKKGLSGYWTTLIVILLLGSSIYGITLAYKKADNKSQDKNVVDTIAAVCEDTIKQEAVAPPKSTVKKQKPQQSKRSKRTKRHKNRRRSRRR